MKSRLLRLLHHPSLPTSSGRFRYGDKGTWEIFPSALAGNRYGFSVQCVESPSLSCLITAATEQEDAGVFVSQNFGDASQKVLAKICRRRGQSRFRRALCEAYENKFAVTGCTILPLLEAAHIHPYKEAHTSLVSNGILLRADVHTLFDLCLIAIDSRELTLIVAPQLMASEYAEWAGQPLFVPVHKASQVSKAALDWH